MLTIQDALDVEKDEPFDSGGQHRLRNVPADPGSADDVQHPAASEVDEQKPGARIHFQIADPTSQPLPVVYRGGQVPDIIGDNIEIVAEGKLDAQGTFTANNVLAKCPSRLENAPPEERDYSAVGT